MQVAKRFGENLRRLRKGADISQEELGLRCSLHRTEIGLLERGARVPRIDTVIKIATALNIRAEALIDGIAWNPATSEAGRFTISSGAPIEEHREVTDESTALRAKQSATTDVTAEICERSRRLEEK
jgi:transcriptional regulator with XRE-family HTH domain